MSTKIPFLGQLRPIPRLTLAVNDLATSAKEWRRWWILAWTDVKQRYRRSRIGQFWLTVSMAAMILGIGSLYSIILQQSIDSSDVEPKGANTGCRSNFRVGPVGD